MTRADVESISSLAARQGMDYSISHQYPLLHKDGTNVQLNLIKLNKQNCIALNGQLGCVGGFTKHTSNYTRRQDIEHPVDTTETINLIYTSKGRTPVISEEDILHELFHAVDIHYMSRTVCETNWRYSECLESKAYDYTYLLRQVRVLQKKGKIILNN